MGIPNHWRTQHQRYRLVGEICQHCGAKLFPPRDVCPECSQPAYEPFTFSGRGQVYSHSTVLHAPRGYEEFVPYTVALVKLEEGPLVTAQLTDVDAGEAYIGMPVEMVTRKQREDGEEGAIIYGYKFRPVLQ
ncbi:MAG: Zn-ribbon domain-containing OB-fold protein [Anaerolineae bacterium]|nr:Zn-ribbon domain-containing OB-fold protein [Anaerolineae bacterium]MDH7472485.1 Zn-ribbon domain-containing OB-fold protein [Anaerolineae bacterium]